MKALANKKPKGKYSRTWKALSIFVIFKGGFKSGNEEA